MEQQNNNDQHAYWRDEAYSWNSLVSGFDITRAAIKAKKLVGIVPEVFCLYDEMTAWDNLNFSAKLHNVHKRKRMALGAQLLQLFGLYGRRNDRVNTFSGGMKKRLMIATALMHDPEILFLDEPTTGLDAQSARQIRTLIKELNGKGMTVFLTTHYIEEADQLCQRIAIIDRGRIIAVDTPEALKNIVKTENIIEVSFDHAGDIVSDLAELSRVRNVIVAGDKFRLYVEDLKDTLPSLVHFAEEKRLQVVSVNTVRPTLEDAFVRLTGLRPDLMTLEKEHRKPR
jgi:ABC-2 type transport system ATP-binding protein